MLFAESMRPAVNRKPAQCRQTAYDQFPALEHGDLLDNMDD